MPQVVYFIGEYDAQEAASNPNTQPDLATQEELDAYAESNVEMYISGLSEEEEYEMRNFLEDPFNQYEMMPHEAFELKYEGQHGNIYESDDGDLIFAKSLNDWRATTEGDNHVH